MFFDPTALDSGMHPLQLHELRTHYWNLYHSDRDEAVRKFKVTCSLEGTRRKGDWKPKLEDQTIHGRFIFVNYLGTAWIHVFEQDHVDLSFKFFFEVITAKLDYDKEYRLMVEAIGRQCQQLLLEWGSPTAVNIVSDEYKQSQTLLEQFLFIRHVLGPEKLELYLRILHESPHTKLAQESFWQHSGAYSPNLFLKDPLYFGKDWEEDPKGLGMVDRWNVHQTLATRKFDSFDTPPNRFVKFALQNFRTVCEEIMSCKFIEDNGKKRDLREEQGAAWNEAQQMRDALDSFLTSRFFAEVGELGRIPFDSQTLQKREGYREILYAWLMLDVAAQIDWPGRNDAYDGSNRDVATLYEFWLFFLLAQAMRTQLRMKPINDPLSKEADGARPFCCIADDGRLMIHLKRNESSFSRFDWGDNVNGMLRIHFFYNRPFSRSMVNSRGTYSKTFRPDYSLVLIPGDINNEDWLQAEKEAESQGRIAYLHFDAKYRIEELSSIVGEDDEREDEWNISKTTGTFKNADLYKMHTYNEAIRRTVGSYVLYPGDDPINELNRNRFERYHEIIPGIGAFALRPSANMDEPEAAGLSCFLTFLENLLQHHRNKFTQSSEIQYWTEGTIRNPPLIVDKVESVALPQADIIFGYMRKATIAKFKSEKFFYCRIHDKNGNPITIDISAAQGAFLIGWSGPRTGPFRTIDWIGRIKSCRLVDRQTLFSETGLDPFGKNLHYLMFRLTDISSFQTRTITTLVNKRNKGPNEKYRVFQATMADLMKCPKIDE